MKKVLAILVVLALVCGAVFATDGEKETHTIKLKTNVGGEIPVFQLVYKAGGKNGEAAKTNDGAAAYDADEAHSYDATADEVEVADISKGNITVTFVAQLQNTAKQVADYVITVKAGAFNALKDTKPYKVNPSEFSLAVIDGLTDARKGVEPKASLNVAADQDQETGTRFASVGLHFNGTTCVAGDLANISVTYPQDEKVDPNESASEYYYANIIMEVVAK